MFRQFLPPDPCVSLLRKKADCLYKRFRFVPGIQLIPEFLQKHQHLAEQIHFTGVAADISGDLIKNFPDPAGMRQMNQSQVFREKLTADCRLYRSIAQQQALFPGHSGRTGFHREPVAKLGDQQISGVRGQFA